MKKLLLILFLSPMFCFAQTNNSQNKQKEVFCIVYATPKTFSKKLNINVDYGLSATDTVQQAMSKQQFGEAGKVVKLETVAQALNYMAAQGWEFVNSYVLDVDGTHTANFIFKRKI